MRIALIIGLCLLNVPWADAQGQVPFPQALDAAAVVQTPMAPEIPGSLILGNGNLNGILWHHNGQFRFSITKNDACDGRLQTAQDPELVYWFVEFRYPSRSP